MKAFVVIISAVAAIKLESQGIPYPALMNEQPSHWRKVWPEGAVDNSDGDAEVLSEWTPECTRHCPKKP